MKIGVITIHFGINYGSALQAYALTAFLKEKGHEVTLINYIPSRYSGVNRNRSVIKNSGVIKGLIKICCGLPSRIIYDNIFNGFLHNYTPLSQKVSNLKELRLAFGNEDVLIAGSDQIWNSDYNEGFDSAYFLSFAGTNTKKYAYAASCGKTQFDQNEIQQIKTCLHNMNAISVRESNMLQLLDEMGIRDAKLVLDPVLLVNTSVWDNLKLPVNLIKTPYLLIYLLDGDTAKTVEIACEIGRLLHLRTVMVTFGHVWSKDNRVDEYLIHKSPVKFINLIRNADYVVTNSFHGMALSIEFNRQFLAFKRKAYNSRLDSLSKLFDLSHRLVSPDISDELIKESIKTLDYTRINEKLHDMRAISERFLDFT